MAQPSLGTKLAFGQVQSATTTTVSWNRPETPAAPGRAALSVPGPRHGTNEQAHPIITVGIADHEILVRGGIRAMPERPRASVSPARRGTPAQPSHWPRGCGPRCC